MTIIRELTKESPSCVWALILLSAIPLFPEYCSPVLAIAAFIMAGIDARQRGQKIQIGTLGKLLILYMLYIAIGISYSKHKLNSLSTVAMWAVMFAAYLTITTVLVSRRRLQTALLLFSLAAGAVGFIACAQYALRNILGISMPNQVWDAVDQLFYRYFPMDVDIHIATHRPASTFNNPNIMSEFLVMMIPLVAVCGFDGQRTRLKLTARLCLLLSIFGVAVSFSRGAYMALLSMLLLIIVTNLRKISPLLISLIAAISLIPEAIISRFFSIGGINDFSITQRFSAWDVAVQAILRNPLFGMGPGISNFSEFVKNAGVNVPHAHNIALQLLIEGGFIGLFLLMVVAIRLLQNSVECLAHSPKTHYFGVFFIAFTVAFVVYGMVDYPFLCPKLMATFFTVLGTADAVTSLYLRQETVPLRNIIPRLHFKKNSK